MLWTVLKTKEYSPEQLDEFERQDHPERFNSDEGRSDEQLLPYNTFQRRGFIWLPIGIVVCFLIWYFKLALELYIVGGGLTAFGLMQLLTTQMVKKGNITNGFVTVTNDLNRMPKTMRQLAIVQFFTWFALFAMWIYTTSAVTSHVYGTNDTSSELFNKGANWVGVTFGVYSLVAALVAFLLPVLAKYTSRKIAHAIALTAGGIGLASIYLVKDPNMLILSMVGVGIAWASILAMPYAILTGSLPQNKMGTYMGIFNFFIVIPQLLAASILGFFVKSLFGGEAIYALVLGGISMVIAAVMVLFVEDKN